MGRYEELTVASIERQATHGWVVGPPLEPEAWRRRVKAAPRRRGWRLATGVRATGLPWTARTDLEDELYAEGRTEREIALELGVSRQRIAEALAAAGVTRRQPARPCPVDRDELRRLADEGVNQAQLASRFSAASGTVSRWLAEAGLGAPDSRVDPALLRDLYVSRRLHHPRRRRGVGHEPQPCGRELELAGILRRTRHDRRRGARQGTKEAVEELYLRRGLTARAHRSLRRQ